VWLGRAVNVMTVAVDAQRKNQEASHDATGHRANRSALHWFRISDLSYKQCLINEEPQS
jgi:hypothetical protein